MTLAVSLDPQSDLQIEGNNILGPEIILVRGWENVAGMLRQKW